MSAHLIDGNALASRIRLEVIDRVAALAGLGHRPTLAVILVGEVPASAVYVRHKLKDCQACGIASRLEQLPEQTPESELLALIQSLNADPTVHGILVQLPLPASIDPRRVIETIDPRKDVDGFHVANAGALMVGLPGFRPCTPYGVMRMLEELDTPLAGARAVVVGRSNIVGKPQAMMLLERGATVTICHSKTRDLGAHTRQADIVVAAVGMPNLITGDLIKPGAIVIDVGMNRITDAQGQTRLCGDVEFESARQVAGAITPVPGGVGPMTRAMLLVNTLEAAERLGPGAAAAFPLAKPQ